jgi:hypothetical protein
MSIQHLILRPGEEPVVQIEESLTYSQIVGIVGYPIEVINLVAGGAVMYVCEEGKQQGQPRNEHATTIANGALRDGDYVVGTVLIVGPLGAGGKDTSLPDDTLNDLLARIEQ